MLSPSVAVQIVQVAERHNEYAAMSDSSYKAWLNPSKLLVERALDRWHFTKMRADNTSVVTLMLDPPGPPKAQVLKDRKKNLPERGKTFYKICIHFIGINCMTEKYLMIVTNITFFIQFLINYCVIKTYLLFQV